MKDHKKDKKKHKHRRDRSDKSRSDSSQKQSKKKHKKVKKQKQRHHEREEVRQSPEIQTKKEHPVKYDDRWEAEEPVKEANPQDDQPQQQQKEMPNFQPSGILLEYYNAREGVALKFNQPAQARAPTDQWRIYPFKDKQPLNPIILRESCYLVGKDDRICDILCENPSISRQHAVIQFRQIHQMEIDGNYISEVKPYLMDLQSTNGTFLNDEKIEHSRYYQLLNKDIIKFGLSEREYVMFKVPNRQNDEEDGQ